MTSKSGNISVMQLINVLMSSSDTGLSTLIGTRFSIMMDLGGITESFQTFLMCLDLSASFLMSFILLQSFRAFYVASEACGRSSETFCKPRFRRNMILCAPAVGWCTSSQDVHILKIQIEAHFTNSKLFLWSVPPSVNVIIAGGGCCFVFISPTVTRGCLEDCIIDGCMNFTSYK